MGGFGAYLNTYSVACGPVGVHTGIPAVIPVFFAFYAAISALSEPLAVAGAEPRAIPLGDSSPPAARYDEPRAPAQREAEILQLRALLKGDPESWDLSLRLAKALTHAGHREEALRLLNLRVPHA